MKTKPVPPPEVPKPDGKSLGMHQDDVARAYGISRERVRQIEVQALRKLRWILRRKGLGFDDFI